jgi:hypothetical protein
LLLDAFGNRAESEGCGDVDDALDHSQPFWLYIELVDEALVDLDDIDREFSRRLRDE